VNRSELFSALMTTLEDGRISRSERQALRSLARDARLDENSRRALQADLFREVRERLGGDPALLSWLEDAVKVLRPDAPRAARCDVFFGPEAPMVETLLGLLGKTKSRLDVAVFTITDDRLSGAMRDLHRRGVQVRILTDDDKQWDKGSDVRRLCDAGLAVVRDQSPHHFHHKFAIVDGRILVNGSYNWTRGADRSNRENFMVTDDPVAVSRYQAGFDDLWRELGGP